MSLLVKDSASPEELRLCLKLFPNSPYRSTFEQRLKRVETQNLSYEDKLKYIKEKKYILGDYPNSSLTSADEAIMASRVINSNSTPQLRLFVKLFPNSRLQSGFSKKIAFLDAQKQHRSEKKDPTQIDTPPPIEEKMEEEVIDKKVKEELLREPLPEEAQEEQIAKSGEEPSAKQVEKKSEEIEKKSTEEAVPEKVEPEKAKPEKEETEKDWGKFEIGIPTQMLLVDSSDNEVDTDEPPAGFFFGWSSEVWLDIGGGVALEYFTQKLPTSGDEFQHLFLETQIRGRLFNIINWGIGYGGGYTTINIANKPAGLEIVPGQGIIYSYSVGFVWDSIGINYAVVNFTGSYSWVLAGSSGTTDWKGTVNMITLEYCY